MTGLLRTIALAALACLAAFVFGVMKGASDERAQWEQARAEADQSATEANGAIAVDAGQAASDFSDLQLRTRTEAADARRFIERHAAPATETPVGSGAVVDPDLALGVLCRVERLRGVPASAECSAADRLAGEPRIAVLTWPTAGSR